MENNCEYCYEARQQEPPQEATCGRISPSDHWELTEAGHTFMRAIGLEQGPVGPSPSEQESVKLCPFRVGRMNMNDGEFLPCYGAECMAYLEYDATPFVTATDGQEKPEAHHIKLCRMMPYPAYYGVGCSF